MTWSAHSTKGLVTSSLEISRVESKDRPETFPGKPETCVRNFYCNNTKLLLNHLLPHLTGFFLKKMVPLTCEVSVRVWSRGPWTPAHTNGPGLVVECKTASTHFDDTEVCRLGSRLRGFQMLARDVVLWLNRVRASFMMPQTYRMTHSNRVKINDYGKQ